MKHVGMELRSAATISDDIWNELRAVQRCAFGSTPERSTEEIDFLLGDEVSYVQSHRNPNTEVGRRFSANNKYTDPRVAIARDMDDNFVGFLYAANNVSGGGPPEGPHNNSLSARAVRLGKQLSVVKNYLWLREVAVMPEYQHQGVARDLARCVLEDAMPRQPVSAYVWPDEVPFLQGVLETAGFQATGEQHIYPFGESNGAIRQVRMEAPSVRSVIK